MAGPNPNVGTDKLRTDSLTITLSGLRKDLLPILVGNVIHLTTSLGLQGIKKDGLIRSNIDGKLFYSYPQSDRSYARARGWVSLFDLRTVSDNQLETGLSNFYFLNPPFVNNNPIFLSLSPLHHPSLLPWTQARDEDAWKEMFIPHIEVFYPGDIPLSHINRVVDVQVTVVD